MAQPDIYLSYNREDAEVARRFAQGFEVAGFDVRWDQALRSGEACDELSWNAAADGKMQMSGSFAEAPIPVHELHDAAVGFTRL